MQSAEALRQRALRALGVHGDVRAHAALAHASIRIRTGVRHWEGSDGHVSAHAIALGVDAHTLGRLSSHPSAYDALCVAVSVAVASERGESVDEVRLHWEPPHTGAIPYRSFEGPQADEHIRIEATALHEAVDAVLAARGHGLEGVDCAVEVRLRDPNIEVRWRTGDAARARDIEEATWIVLGGLPERRTPNVSVYVRVGPS